MKKIISVIILAVVLVSVFASCGETTAKTAEKVFTNTLTANEVMDKSDAVIATKSELSAIDDMYFEYMVKVTKANASSYVIKLQPNGTTLDEVGVIKASDASKVDGILAEVKAYLADRNAAWTGLYLTEEYPKLKNAEAKAIGEYVVYAILSDSEKAAFFSAVEAAIAK